MKRSINLGAIAIAIALGFAVGPISAQGVTMAGRLDMGLQRIDNGTTTQKRVDSGTYTASRLIFRGNEDLGGGLGALFYLEHRFNADTGLPQSAKFWNAGSYVGLSSTNWGTVTLGRQYVPIFWPFLWSDDTGNAKLHGYSAVQSVQRSNFARVTAAASPIKTAGGLDSIAGGIYALNISSAFEDNLVVYKSPSFSNISASLAVGAPEGYPAGNGKIYGGNVEYRTPANYVGVGYNSKEGRVPAGGVAESKITEWVLGGLYSVTKEFKGWGNYHRWNFDSAGATLKGNDYMLGLSYGLPLSMVWINYANKSVDNCVACDSKGFGIGYHYLLSKRTELYTALGNVKNEPNSANNLAGFSPDAPGKSIRGLVAGIYHNF